MDKKTLKLLHDTDQLKAEITARMRGMDVSELSALVKACTKATPSELSQSEWALVGPIAAWGLLAIGFEHMERAGE